jgi:hypothetical protein
MKAMETFMRYWLELHEQSVHPYLIGLAVSREARIKIATFLQQFREQADVYRADSSRRLTPESSFFKVDFVFRDPSTATLKRLRLVVSDAAAAHGVLRVVYADLT